MESSWKLSTLRCATAATCSGRRGLQGLREAGLQACSPLALQTLPPRSPASSATLLATSSHPPQEERERGYFDEAGNYVEREDKDAAEEAKDAWLQSDEGKRRSWSLRLCWVTSWGWWWDAAEQAQGAWLRSEEGGWEGRARGRVKDEGRRPPHPALPACPCLPCCALTLAAPLTAICAAAKVVSEEVRRKIEERQRALEAAEAAGPLSATQIARLQYQAAQVGWAGGWVGSTISRMLQQL